MRVGKLRSVNHRTNIWRNANAPNCLLSKLKSLINNGVGRDGEGRGEMAVIYECTWMNALHWQFRGWMVRRLGFRCFFRMSEQVFECFFTLDSSAIHSALSLTHFAQPPLPPLWTATREERDAFDNDNNDTDSIHSSTCETWEPDCSLLTPEINILILPFLLLDSPES